MMPRTVLIVDGDAENRKNLGRMLEDEYRVLEANNGAEALTALENRGESVSVVLLDLVSPQTHAGEALARMRAEPLYANTPAIAIIRGPEAEARALSLGADDFIAFPYRDHTLRHRLANAVSLKENARMVDAIQRDPLTGLLNREAFFARAERMIAEKPPEYYVMACFDICNFKFINDQYGSAKGDDVLKYIADVFREGFRPVGGICARITEDNFAVLYPRDFIHTPGLKEIRRKAEMPAGLARPITYGIGRYLVTDANLSASAMYDRAAIAESAVRARFDVRIAQFDESMRESILAEHEIISEMSGALATGQFETWLQPQYNHASGALIGAEALVRWRHPEKGILSPDAFIPVFERNGFIYEMDKFVWEQACQLLKRFIDDGVEPLPISVNISRYDVFRDDFQHVITSIVEKYGISRELLRLEITESAFTKSTRQMMNAVKKLTENGFTIEIDDFGSGYSSLNTLKDVPTDILKLDMRFLDSENSQRGGNILESVIRMAKWLGMPVIAEGVETREQADYLRSIGCFYVQGYLYARPMPADEYRGLVESAVGARKLHALQPAPKLENNAFWNPLSMETLIFNSYVGGACIVEYTSAHMELLRVNEKFARALGGSALTLEDALTFDFALHMTVEQLTLMRATARKAAETGEEVSCELCLQGLPGAANTYIHATARAIARADERALLYCAVTNITDLHAAQEKHRLATAQLKAIIEGITGGVTATMLLSGVSARVFASSGYFSLFGYTRTQFRTELPGGVADLIDPNDLPAVLRAEAENKLPKAKYQVEYRARKRSGEMIWVRDNGSVCVMEGYARPLRIVISSDITREKEALNQIEQAAGQLRLLNDTAHELLAISDVEAGIKDVLVRVRDYFMGSRAYVLELDPEKNTFCNTYEVCAPGVKSEMEALSSVPTDIIPYWQSALEGDQYVTIDNVAALNGARAEEKRILQAQGIESLVAVPLMREGRAMGFLGVDDPQRHSSHVGHLKAIGDYVTVLIVRRALNRELESDRANMLALMDDTPGGLVRMRVKKDGAIVPIYANKSFLTLVGMTADEFFDAYAESAMWGVPDEDLPLLNNAVETLLSEGEAYSRPYRLRHKSGGYVWVMFFGRKTLGDAGEVLLNIYYTDVSRQRGENLALQENERVLRLAAAHSNRLIYRYDAVNHTARADMFTSGGDAVVRHLENLPQSMIESGQVLPESADDFARMFKEIHSGAPEGACKAHIRDAMGVPRWLDVRFSLLSSLENTPEAAVISVLEITQAHERELAYSRYQQSISQSDSADGKLAFFEADITANVIERAGGKMLPRSIGIGAQNRANLIDSTTEAFILPEDAERCRKFFSREHLITQFSDGARSLSDDFGMRMKEEGAENGFMHVDLQMVQDPYTGHIKVYTIIRDVTSETLAQLRVKKQAEADGMTGLTNKTHTETLVRARLARADGAPCALMIADLDSLKGINDTYGHNCGDEAIRAIARILRGQFRRTDIVGRIGGDEFLVFLDGAGDEAAVRAAANSFLSKLSEARIGGEKSVRLHGSVGIAMGKAGEDAYEALFQMADRALYHIKRNGKNNCAVYSPELFAAPDPQADASPAPSLRRPDDDALNMPSAYALVAHANLTRNTCAVTQGGEASSYDSLVDRLANALRPEDCAAFIGAVSRDALLAAYRRGARATAFDGLEKVKNDAYTRVHTDAILLRDEEKSDIIAVLLIRQTEPGGSAE